MSIFVSGMKMPTCCIMCPLWNHEWGYCNFCGKDSKQYDENGELLYDVFEERYKDCPLQEVAEERPQGEWIPVSERLPEYSGLYLISVDELVTVANFTGTYFMHRGGFVEVDAWMPLIEPYKKDGGKEE